MKFSEINPEIEVWVYKRIMEMSSLTEEEEKIVFGSFFEELNGANDQIEKFLETSKKNTIKVSPGDMCFPVQISLFLGMDKIVIHNTDTEVKYVGGINNDIYFTKDNKKNKFTVDLHRHLFYVDTLVFKDKQDVDQFIIMVKMTFAGSKIEIKVV